MIDAAPKDEPILVWVSDICPRTKKPEGWKMGRCVQHGNLPPKLIADGFNGDWRVEIWHPLPAPPTQA